VPSLIVTLATGSVVTGGTLALDHGASGGVVPAWITSSVSMTSRTWIIPVPPIVVGWLLLALLVVLAERRTMFAKKVFASGMNRAAARLALVREPALWAAAFTISAVFAAVTGFLLSGFSGGADVSVGDPYMFRTVAAVVVGGTSLLGGAGSYWRTVVGSILITELSTLLLGVGFGTQTQLICLGILIVVLVLLYGRQAHVSRLI
jgi:ribose transport system permease protein